MGKVAFTEKEHLVLEAAQAIGGEEGAHAFISEDLVLEAGVLDQAGFVEGNMLFGVIPVVRLTDKGRKALK